MKEFYWKKFSNWKSFPKTIFDVFPNLKFVEIHCGIETLSAHDFEKANHLDGLHLMRNNLKHIRAGTFDLLKKVDTLDLECNEIIEIEENAFNGMSALQTLSINSNRLTTIKKNTFSGAPKLRTINMNMNEVSLIEDGAFDLPQIMEIYLADNNLKTLPNKLFANAPLISHLDLSTNDIDAIPQTLYQTSTLDNIILDANDLQGIKLSDVALLQNVKYVSLENVGLTLPAVVENSTVQSKIANIDLSHNDIQTANILNHLTIFKDLETISINNNAIHRINEIENIKNIFVNISSIYIQNNAVDCQWLSSVLPALKEGEIDLDTGSYNEKFSREEQGQVVDGQLCGEKN